jgi:DNA polymerase-3 subunit epsilon
MNSFAALDFETANHHKSSVCSIGIVIVEDNVIVDKFYELIKPNPNFYNPINTEIHGLNYFDTIDAREFPEVWNSIYPRINHLPLLAHNSAFDEGCLKAAHAVHAMKYSFPEFYCTVKLSRKKLPHLPNHKLKTVSSYLNFDLINHHNALADAEACAWIAMNIF